MYTCSVPLLSRLLPSDICKIYKSGTCIRLDSTLGDFTEMRWHRGDLSFIFNGEDDRDSNTLSMVVLDNQTKVYQKMKLLGSVSCVLCQSVRGCRVNESMCATHIEEQLHVQCTCSLVSRLPSLFNMCEKKWVSLVSNVSCELYRPV